MRAGGRRASAARGSGRRRRARRRGRRAGRGSGRRREPRAAAQHRLTLIARQRGKAPPPHFAPPAALALGTHAHARTRMCSSRARPAGEGVAARTSQSKTALNCSQHCCPTCTPSRSTHSAWKPCLRDQSGARRLCGQGQGARVCLPVAVSPSPGADVARGLQEVDGSILVVASNQEDVRRIKHLCAAAPTPVTALMHAGMRCGLRTDWAALRTSERAVGHAMGLPPAGCAPRPRRGHPLRVSGTRYACGGRKGGERGEGWLEVRAAIRALSASSSVITSKLCEPHTAAHAPTGVAPAIIQQCSA